MIELISDIALGFAFAGFAVFCVLYFLRSDWQSSSVGRNAMALMGACALLLGLAVVRLFGGDAWFERHRDVLRLVSYSLIGAIVWWRVALLIKLQRRKGRAGVSARTTPTRRD